MLWIWNRLSIIQIQGYLHFIETLNKEHEPYLTWTFQLVHVDLSGKRASILDLGFSTFLLDFEFHLSFFDRLAPLEKQQKNLRKNITSVLWQLWLNMLFLCIFLFAFSAPEELRSIIQEVKYRSGLQSAKLIRQLRRRDRLCHKLQKNYDIITACLQAVSQKRRKNTRFFLCFNTKEEEGLK